MTGSRRFKVQSFTAAVSYVLLSIFHRCVFSILHRLPLLLFFEERLDVQHGLLNVLTEAVRVLQDGSERFEREQKMDVNG